MPLQKYKDKIKRLGYSILDPLAPVFTTSLLLPVEWKMPDSISNNEYLEPICKN